MQFGRQRRALLSVRFSSTHPLACCLGRLLTVIAISNPAGALCALERRASFFLVLFSLLANTFLLSALTAPEHVNWANGDRQTFNEDQEDDCNGHLLREKRPIEMLRPGWITRRRRFSPLGGNQTSRYRIYSA